MSFLSVIIDCNACNWGAYIEKERGNNQIFNNVVSSIVAFCNAHMLTSLNNQLLVLAGGIKGRDKRLFSSINCTETNRDSAGSRN